MDAATGEDDLAALRACRDCGLFQILPSIEDGEVALCLRCGATLRRAARASLPFTRVSSVVAAVLLVLALDAPFVELRIFGRTGESTLLTGPALLWDRGLPELALAVLFTLIVFPAAKLLLQLVVLFGVTTTRPPPWLPWLFAWLERISPWAMVEVFLLGSFVAYTRLRALAQVEFGTAIWAMGGVMLLTVAIDATLDREALWQDLEAKTPRPTGPTSSASILGCRECKRVARAEEGAACPRCHHALFSRKPRTLTRVWALVTTAALLYIPANVLPVMTVERLGRGGPKTILHGVVELAQDHLWPLAVLVLFASIIVPIVKLASLVLMLVMTHRRSGAVLAGRTRLYRFIQIIGRWSMIDIFMLATLVGVVRFGFLALVLPGMGAVAFCGVVMITMIATELFDPRLMWDAAESQASARPPEAIAAS